MKSPAPKKTSLDKDLKKVGLLQAAGLASGQRMVKIGICLVFLVAIWIISTIGYYDFHILPAYENSAFVVAAAIIGGYMALNIGANDVANNVGPAVGSKALTLVGALAIATVFEAAGAILAGGDVVATIKKGIIDPALMPDAESFIRAMMAALLAAALWLNLATWIGAPVSTTHAIVGGVMGAGVAATGFGTVNWLTLGKIAASWVVSPLLGGVIAALFLAFIKGAIYGRDDMLTAARRWVPVLVAIMAAVFSLYLAMKGLKKVWRAEPATLGLVAFLAFLLTYVLVKPAVGRASRALENRRKAVSTLFTIPLIRTVGEQITRLDRPRAFCVALSAAITVIVASTLGLPVSSTHIAVGGIFGVGFLREYLNRRRARRSGAPPSPALAGNAAARDTEERRARRLAKARDRRLVRRTHLRTIVAAWVVTVPLTALLAALLNGLFAAFV